MLSPIDTQFMSLIISVFAGLIIGLLYDLYRTINYYTKPSKFFLLLMDLLFWLVTGGVSFSVLLRADFAELRIYTFLGIGVGVFIYFKLFSEYILKFYRRVIYIITKFVRFLFIFITLPFKLLYNFLWVPASFIKKLIVSRWKIMVVWLSSIFRRKTNKK